MSGVPIHLWTTAECVGSGTAGQARQTWLSTIESDVAPLDIGLATAYHQAQHRHGSRTSKWQRPLDKPHDDDWQM